MVKKYRKYVVFCTFFSFFLTASKFLNIDFSGQSSNENLNSGFGEKGTARKASVLCPILRKKI